MQHPPQQGFSSTPQQELFECEQELKNMGFSEAEIHELNSQIDGIIERGFDKYFSEF